MCARRWSRKSERAPLSASIFCRKIQSLSIPNSRVSDVLGVSMSESVDWILSAWNNIRDRTILSPFLEKHGHRTGSSILSNLPILFLLICCWITCDWMGSLKSFTLSIPSWQIVTFFLGCISVFVHYCARNRSSYSKRTFIRLSGLSLFLASTAASELTAQDDTGVQQLLWCLCTSILTDNYDPNMDAQPWQRLMWIISTWLQLGLMFNQTTIASSPTHILLLRAVVVFKGFKLHYLHGWHCSSWDETKGDSKTQCEHLAAVATFLAIDWTPHVESGGRPADYLAPVSNNTSNAHGHVHDAGGADAYLWRSLLEGKPRLATLEGFTTGRDCCDIVVKLRRPGPVVPAVAFSIKRQYKAKLGSLATMSSQYAHLAFGEFLLAAVVMFWVGLKWRTEKTSTLPTMLCMTVWFCELLYHLSSMWRAFDIADVVHQQSSETCRSKKFSEYGVIHRDSRIITELIVGSLAEAVMTIFASFGKGAEHWEKLSKYNIIEHFITMSYKVVVICIAPLVLLTTFGKFCHTRWRTICKKSELTATTSSSKLDEQLVDCITNLERLLHLVKTHEVEMELVQGVMYPSVSSTAETSPEAPAAPAPHYALTALEAVFFLHLLGQAAAGLMLMAEENTDEALRNLWNWTSRALTAGVIDSSWLSPNISRAMWHAATFEKTEIWQSALKDVQQVLVGNISPSTPPTAQTLPVSTELGVVSLEAARRAVMHMLAQLQAQPAEPTQEQGLKSKLKPVMRAALFAIVGFCRNWGGPETVAVPGPLEHECLMACLIAPAFKSKPSSPSTATLQ